MPEITVQLVIFLLGVAGLTALAAFWDLKERRIPNWLTLPVFGAGWVYQLWFNGLGGLADGGLGFLVGFGTLFVLWMVGGGGGGDVKLMGALSVWLGFRMTLMVMIASTAIVILMTVFFVAYGMIVNGPYATKRKLLATGKPQDRTKAAKRETSQEKASRRVMAYAVPVALATWSVLVWKLPTFPWT
ncbi:A24 family peptidase [Lacunimicrobium album]